MNFANTMPENILRVQSIISGFIVRFI